MSSRPEPPASGDRERRRARGEAPMWLIGIAVLAAAGAVGTAVAAPRTPVPALWASGAAVVLAAGAVLLGSGLHRRLREAREGLAAETASRAVLESETAHLARGRLPQVVAAAASGPLGGDGDPGPAHAELSGSRLAADHASVVKTVDSAVRAERDLSESTQIAFLSVARRIQVMAHDQQRGLTGMQRRYDDPDVLDGLMTADHAAAQQARLAQTLAVLCGARPGRQWSDPVRTVDVVRAGQGRILGYQRVKVRSGVDAAVVGPAVEPLIHAVAELLDNATRFSPPSTAVHVSVRAVHAGAVIEIDDGGVGMPEQAMRAAEATLSGADGVDVTQLGETPKLGLAVAGRLAEQYGFRITLASPSPYGGVRAIVLVPSVLLTDAPPAPAVPPQEAADAAEGHATAGAGDIPGRTAAAEPGTDPARRGTQAPAAASTPRRAPSTASTHGGTPPSAHGGTPATGHPAEPANADPDPDGNGNGNGDAQPRTTAAGLPQRRNRRGAGTGPAPAAPRPVPGTPAREPERAGAFMRAFQTGTRGGRDASATTPPGNGAPATPPGHTAAAPHAAAAPDGTRDADGAPGAPHADTPAARPGPDAAGGPG